MPTTDMTHRRAAVLGLLVLLVFAVGGCGPSAPAEYPRIDPPSLSVGDGSVLVSGDTDLPEAARLDLTALDDRGDKATGAAVVGGGHYNGRIDVHGWPSGKVTIGLEFRPADPSQPGVVAERYGRDGRRMVGGRIRTDPDADTARLEWFGAYDVDLR